MREGDVNDAQNHSSWVTAQESHISRAGAGQQPSAQALRSHPHQSGEGRRALDRTAGGQPD